MDLGQNEEWIGKLKRGGYDRLELNSIHMSGHHSVSPAVG